MKEQEIRRAVQSFITTSFGVQGELDPNSSLTGSGVISSLSMIELICWIEETFKLSIPPDDYLPKYFDSINSICKYISAKKA